MNYIFNEFNENLNKQHIDNCLLFASTEIDFNKLVKKISVKYPTNS